MKSDTVSYIHLQRLYKARAEEEKNIFKGLVKIPLDDAVVDAFVKNAHGLKVMRGTRWGVLDTDRAALGEFWPCP
jgi:amyloid beta precursor protein binding protein 1